MQVWRILFGLLVIAALSGCPSPLAPPGPPAEIPSSLVIPRDLSINVNELQSPSTTALKAQTFDSSDVRVAIDIAAGVIEDTNDILDAVLFPLSQDSIPVDPNVTTFRTTTPLKEGSSTLVEIKIDFGRFDLDGDGVDESCSGCTCPVGCAPALAACPTEAPEDQLQPICFRIWLNGEREVAGLFNRVPTIDDPESGRFRLILTSLSSSDGSLFSVVYDHRDPENLATDLSAFFKEESSGLTDFFARRHSATFQEGPEAEAKKTVRLTTDFLSPPNALPGFAQFQGTFFSNQDLIDLEAIADGVFAAPPPEGFDDNITPPICAQISTANQVADSLCSDLGLTLTPGDFGTLPELVDVQLPPVSEFPEAPTF